VAKFATGALPAKAGVRHHQTIVAVLLATAGRVS